MSDDASVNVYDVMNLGEKVGCGAADFLAAMSVHSAPILPNSMSCGIETSANAACIFSRF